METTQTRTESGAYRALGRTGILVFVVIAGLFVSFFALIGPPDESLGIELSDLLAAAGKAGAWRVFATIDLAGWLSTALFLLMIALTVRRRARGAAVVAVCAAGQGFGALGAAIRLVALPVLAERFNGGAGDPLIPGALAASGVIAACFFLGGVFASVGFLVAAWSVRGDALLPGWLPAVFGVLGVLPLVFQLNGAWGGPDLFFLLFIYLIVLGATGLILGVKLRQAE